MNDIRFPAVRSTPSSASRPETLIPAVRGQGGDGALFDQALQRSVDRRASSDADRTAERSPERSKSDDASGRAAERVVESRRDAERAEAGTADSRRAQQQAADRRVDSSTPQRQTRPDDDGTPAPRAAGTEDTRATSREAAAPPSSGAREVADADQSPAANATTASARPAATTADPSAPSHADSDLATATAALVAASAALISPAARTAGAGTGTIDSATSTPDDAPAAAEAPLLLDDGDAARLPTANLPSAATAIAPKAKDAASTAKTDGSSRAPLPELSAELTRTPAKDRLLEDFEKRFETSLARAAGGSTSPLQSASPLVTAGLPQHLSIQSPSMTVAYAGVAAPLGHPAFANDLSHRILMFAGQRVQSAELSVTPNELGPISVSIEVRGQEAAMQFSAAHAATRAAIEDAMPRLREMLAAQGLHLTQADVGDHSQRDAGSTPGGNGGRPREGSNAARAGAAGSQDTGPVLARRVGLIDIRV